MSERVHGSLQEDAEIKALSTVIGALTNLTAQARNRVLEYAKSRLDSSPGERPTLSKGRRSKANRVTTDVSEEEWLSGVCYQGQKWMQRHEIAPEQMSMFYRLREDEIAMSIDKLPGTSLKARFRNLILLQGVASYLHRGVRRIDPKTLKLTMTRYDADPGSNFATYLKGLTAEMSGSRVSGLALTTRGLNSAKSLIKQMGGV